jgi:Tol biopolymer transport system component
VLDFVFLGKLYAVKAMKTTLFLLRFMPATLLVVAFSGTISPLSPPQAALGVFENHIDIGDTPLKGSASYDAATGEYRLTGGGANMWAKTDAFHFAWKRITGNFSLTADVRFVGKGVAEHRKAAVMVRENLDANSAYADVALHGDGLTALQFRPVAGAETSEVRSSENAPLRIRIERRGAQFIMYAGRTEQSLVRSFPVTVDVRGPVYVGLGICSHDVNVVETAIFSNVSIQDLPATAPDPNPEKVHSKISIFDLADRSVHVVYSADQLWEAPNWSPDGRYLVANSGGRLYRFILDGNGQAKPEMISLDSGYRCNNDHGLSPDGKRLAFSAEKHESARGSQVYLASADGAQPQLLTPRLPSYFHGWSPDGRWLTFVGKREGSFNIYRVSVNGGDEERLTSKAGFDDGPDYSPDGKWIYVNSHRSGGWDIWKFPADGAGPQDSQAVQITADAQEDWFPHPSPDGKWLVFLSFPPGTQGHDFKTAVQLRVMPLAADNAIAKAPPGDEGAIKVLTRFFGGQGTINVNSWSPDAKKFAFVSYELLP